MLLLLTVKVEKWAPIGRDSDSAGNTHLNPVRQTRPSKYLPSSITKLVVTEIASSDVEFTVNQHESYLK